ncbi:hypothetical protein T492DRAFT_845565 [Pavlovales sp. CCMP2436]|nr:hypothetical protein T492DRAFT_845565 [Pavlovales sp. CCMP2436]
MFQSTFSQSKISRFIAQWGKGQGAAGKGQQAEGSRQGAAGNYLKPVKCFQIHRPVVGESQPSVHVHSPVHERRTVQLWGGEGGSINEWESLGELLVIVPYPNRMGTARDGGGGGKGGRGGLEWGGLGKGGGLGKRGGEGSYRTLWRPGFSSRFWLQPPRLLQNIENPKLVEVGPENVVHRRLLVATVVATYERSRQDKG